MTPVAEVRASEDVTALALTPTVDVDMTTSQAPPAPTIDVQRFGVLAPLLAANGFEPVPIAPGTKRPASKGWQHGGFALRAADFSNSYTGILTGDVVAIDIDVSDPELVQQIEVIVLDVLDCHERPPPARVGMPPRRLLMFRTEEPFTKMQTAEYALRTDPVIDGKPKASKVEVLGDGQQFIAYAIHPVTGVPYAWNGGGEPRSMRRSELLHIDHKQALEIIRRSDELLAAHCGATPKAQLPALVDALPAAIDERTVTELRSALNILDAGPRHTWIAIGHALKGLGSVGRELWLTWSQTSDKFDAADAARVWESLNPKSTGYAAVFKAAQEAGWVNPRSKAAVLDTPAGSGAARAAIEDPDGRTQLPPATVEQQEELLIKACDLMRDLKPIDWLIEDWVEANAMSMLYGPSGVGKSFLMVEWACCVATGTPFFSKKVKKGPVVLVIGEGGRGIAKRLAAWEKERGVSLKDAQLYFTTRPIQILDRESALGLVKAVDKEVAAMGGLLPVYIGIDTLARNFGPGDENSAADASRFIETVDELLRRRYSAHIQIVHHSGHEAGRARGSSAFRAAMDQEFSFTSVVGGSIVKLEAKKMKDAEKPQSIDMAIKVVDLGVDTDQNDITSLVLDRATSELDDVITDMKDRKLRVVDYLGLIEDGQVPSYRDIAAKLEVSKKRVETAIGKLESRGLIGPGHNSNAHKLLTSKGLKLLSDGGRLLGREDQFAAAIARHEKAAKEVGGGQEDCDE